MEHRRTAVAWAVACWSLLPAVAWGQTSDESFDARLERLSRIIERQQKIIQALEERVGDLELVRVRGRGVGPASSTSSSATTPSVPGPAAGQPSGSLVAQSGNASSASESTPAGRTDSNEKPRIQSKDLVFQSEHAPLSSDASRWIQASATAITTAAIWRSLASLPWMPSSSDKSTWSRPKRT